MIADLMPYPLMKDSGVPWLGKVPQHWEVGALKRFAWFKSGAGFPVAEQGRRNYEIPFLKVSDMTRPGNEVWTEMTESTVSSATATRLGAFVFPAGSIIFPKVGGALLTNKRRLLRRPSCIDNNVMGCIVSEADINYAFILLQQLDLGRLAKPGPVPAIGEGEVRAIRGPLPPLPEQVAIVRFLDHADRRILRYIRAKQKLVKLLEEQKQAIIHQAVTGRIDVRTGQPYAAYKDSGVEWLGAVPAHWEVRRNGRLFVQRNETGFPELPILEVSLNTGVRIRDFENSDRKQIMAVRTEYKRAAQGDIAYNMMRMWQGAVGMVPVDGLVSPAYVVARPLKGTESRYFSNLFRTKAYMAEVDKYSRGIVRDRNRLYWEDFKQIPTPYPPPDEQGRIVQYLDKTTVYVDTAIVRADRQSELLQEYRTRLIADIVTGKLDVREAAARLPEVDPLADEFDALTTQATETGMMAQEDATESSEELAMENEVII